MTTPLADAARAVEHAVRRYACASPAGSEAACRAAGLAFMQLFRAMLPHASDEAIEAMTRLSLVETARGQLVDALAGRARIIDISGDDDAQS